MTFIKQFLLFLLILHFASPATYAQSFSLSLYPEKHEIISKRGQTIVLPYSLSNLGDPTLLSFKVYSLKTDTKDGRYDLVAYDESDSTPQFAVINSAMELGKPFLMNSNSTVLFDVEVTIPAETKLQDYYFTFVTESEGMKGSEGVSSINLEGGVGSHIVLTVTDTGELDKSAHITKFEIPSTSFIYFKGQKYFLLDSSKEVPIALVLANNGNNYIKATGTINGLKDVIAIPQTIILAGSEKLLKTSSSPRDSTATIPAGMLGIKTLSTTVALENAQVLYANTHIIAFPFTLMSILFGIAVLILSALLFRKYKHKK